MALRVNDPGALPENATARLSSRERVYLPEAGTEAVVVTVRAVRGGQPLDLSSLPFGPVRLGWTARHGERPSEWARADMDPDGRTVRVLIGPDAADRALRVGREARGQRRHLWVVPGDQAGLPVLYAGCILFC